MPPTTLATEEVRLEALPMVSVLVPRMLTGWPPTVLRAARVTAWGVVVPVTFRVCVPTGTTVSAYVPPLTMIVAPVVALAMAPVPAAPENCEKAL